MNRVLQTVKTSARGVEVEAIMGKKRVKKVSHLVISASVCQEATAALWGPGVEVRCGMSGLASRRRL